PPSIVISNTDFNERNQNETNANGEQSDVTMLSEEQKQNEHNNFGMIITEVNGANANTTKHIFGDDSNHAFGMPQHAQQFGEFDDSNAFSTVNNAAIEHDNQIGAVVKPEGK